MAAMSLGIPVLHLVVRSQDYFKDQRLPQFRGMEATCITTERIRQQNTQEKESRSVQRRANRTAMQVLTGQIVENDTSIVVPSELSDDESLADIRRLLGVDQGSSITVVNIRKFKGSITGGSESTFKVFKHIVENLEKRKIAVCNKDGDLKLFDIDCPADRAQLQRFVHKPDTLNKESFDQVLASLKDSDVLVYTYIPNASVLEKEHVHPEYLLKKPDLDQVESAFHELSYEQPHRVAKYGVIRDPQLAAMLGLSRLSNFS